MLDIFQMYPTWRRICVWVGRDGMELVFYVRSVVHNL